MLSPEKQVAKLTRPSCQHTFSSKDNLSRHFSVCRGHRPDLQPVIARRMSWTFFLNEILSPYDRKERIRELFIKPICQVINCWSLLFPVWQNCYRPRRLCPKMWKGEIVEEAVKEEFAKLCVNLYKTFPSLPCNLVVSRKTKEDWFTPERRWLRFVDDRNDPKSLLEHLIIQNEVQACETMMKWCNGKVAKNTWLLCCCFSKRTTTLFLSLDWDCGFI